MDFVDLDLSDLMLGKEEPNKQRIRRLGTQRMCVSDHPFDDSEAGHSTEVVQLMV